MKQALVIVLTLAMMFAAFADEPAGVGEVVTFNLFSTGTKNTEGSGVWGDLGIKLVNDPARAHNSGTKHGQAVNAIAMPKIEVAHAKIHFGDMFYLGITAGISLAGIANIDVGEGKVSPEFGIKLVGDKNEYKAGVNDFAAKISF